MGRVSGETAGSSDSSGAAGTTIAAVATPAGSGERGVLRLSGPHSRAILRQLWLGPAPDLAARGFHRGRVADGRGEQPVLLVWMPRPASYTREDVAELHTLGAPPLVAALFERLLALGAEAAAPGEFTRRAFINGRLDLTRAEGVLALVESRTEDQRRAATTLLSGGLERLLSPPMEGLEDLRALAEAGLDFSPEDTGHVERDEQLERGAAVILQLDRALAFEAARIAPGGLPRVVLYGAPSAGKSTLFNALVEAGPGGPALVHAEPGTTRDRLRGLWHLSPPSVTEPLQPPSSSPGISVELWDTPGPASAAQGAAALAQDAARDAWTSADLILWVVDSNAPHPGREPPGPAPRILVWSQCDRPESAAPPPEASVPARAVSALTGQGLAELARAVHGALSPGSQACQVQGTEIGAALASGESAGLLRELSAHHRQALLAARRALAQALRDLAEGGEEDLFAEGLRQASANLGRITGSTAPEDLLARIFDRFCIGK
ncbi:MAG: 50S ribosome-binding GTPase [Planctomycetota bacterium]|nr:50S ribosome-binding GTPase [Planctomycetota bacterium]